MKKIFSLLLILVVSASLSSCSNTANNDEMGEPRSEKLTKPLLNKRVAEMLKTIKPGLKTEFRIGETTEFVGFHDFAAAYKDKRKNYMLELRSAQYSPSEIDNMLDTVSMAIYRRYGNRHYALIEFKDYNEFDKGASEFRDYKQYFFAGYQNDAGKWVLFEIEPLFNTPDTRLKIREFAP